VKYTGTSLPHQLQSNCAGRTFTQIVRCRIPANTGYITRNRSWTECFISLQFSGHYPYFILSNCKVYISVSAFKMYETTITFVIRQAWSLMKLPRNLIATNGMSVSINPTIQTTRTTIRKRKITTPPIWRQGYSAG
jgi:hypothetical protein